MTVVRTRSDDETIAAGRTFGASLHPGEVVALTGMLGSGKTRFVTGICEGLGVSMHATSPTFTLINEYPAPFGTVAHIDLYRIGTKAELAELGIEEYFTERCICLIEWAELAMDVLPSRYYEVHCSHGGGDSEREIRIRDVRRTAA